MDFAKNLIIFCRESDGNINYTALQDHCGTSFIQVTGQHNYCNHFEPTAHSINSAANRHESIIILFIINYNVSN